MEGPFVLAHCLSHFEVGESRADHATRLPARLRARKLCGSP